MKKLSMFLMFSMFIFVGVQYANGAAKSDNLSNCVKTSTNPCTKTSMEQSNADILGGNNSRGKANKNNSSSGSNSSSSSESSSSSKSNSSSSKSKLWKYGMSGQEVTDIQNALIAKKYFRGKASGKFDMSTQDAVKAFQKFMKLRVDGIVGDETSTALFKK